LKDVEKLEHLFKTSFNLKDWDFENNIVQYSCTTRERAFCCSCNFYYKVLRVGKKRFASYVIAIEIAKAWST
jgi:hypothetical protein